MTLFYTTDTSVFGDLLPVDPGITGEGRPHSAKNQVQPVYNCRIVIICLVCLLVLTCSCHSLEKRKYGLVGPVVGEKVDTFEDYWTDCGPFKPNDPSKKMRRGKAGVIRFFKKGNYTDSVRVEGNFIVYVFHGAEDGIELTQPQAKLVLTAEQLEKQRRYDKKVGHSYHVWLDLGEVDQPEEEISLLSIFTDAKTGEQTSSKVVRTNVPGTPVAKAVHDENASPEEIRRRLFKQFEEEQKQRSKSSQSSAAPQSSPGQTRDHSVQGDNRVTTIDVSSISHRFATADPTAAPTVAPTAERVSLVGHDTAVDTSRERLLATFSARTTSNTGTSELTSGVFPQGKQKYTLEEARHLPGPLTPPGNATESAVAAMVSSTDTLPETRSVKTAPSTLPALSKKNVTLAGKIPPTAWQAAENSDTSGRGKQAAPVAASPQARSTDYQSGQPQVQ
ncbi:MAG: hypothetical protein PHQ75_04290, partial [Thermoguttaceae bacterium]|nr:hypothetical protein [Thermoguttaceae bacterium]